MNLSETQQRFILHWGEMGTKWGINRTVAQIHALLYISPTPRNAEDIAATLGVARSNVSTSLRELQGWGIVRVVHILGDRRDHFESLKDVWEMFEIILDERKRREVDPTLLMLRELLEKAPAKTETDRYSRERLSEMLEFMESVAGFYNQVRAFPRNSIRRLVKMGDKVRKTLSAAD